MLKILITCLSSEISTKEEKYTAYQVNSNGDMIVFALRRVMWQFSHLKENPVMEGSTYKIVCVYF